MSEHPQQEKSRTADVLAPGFAEGLDGMPTDELRRRRDLALAEREYQSYLRRLIQVRQDLLTAERDRRVDGRATAPVVERLTAVLSEGPRAPGRGEALRLVLSDQDMAEAEAQADALVSESGVGDPGSLSDEQLDRALAGLEQGERSVSNDRNGVIRVVDRLQDELKRRYRNDPSQIPRNP